MLLPIKPVNHVVLYSADVSHAIRMAVLSVDQMKNFTAVTAFTIVLHSLVLIA